MARKKKFSNPTRISPRTLDKRREMEPKDLENSEPDDEDTEFEAQELEKEKSTTEADDNENEAENNEVGNIKSKTNQKGKNKMAEKNEKYKKLEERKQQRLKKDERRLDTDYPKDDTRYDWDSNGSIAVTEVPAATTEFPHIVEWRQTYNTYTDARFMIKFVVERLLFDHQLGREFKMNFLLLYVHATISEQVVVEDQTPLMKSWDTMKLKLREKEELNMGGFGRMRVKEAYRYVEKHRLTKGKIREMKNSPAKDQYDILRHVYTPKVGLEDGVFGDVEGTNKMEAIKHFQKRTDEEMENSIKNTLKFTESVRNKVDEMLEIALITNPYNEEFKRLVEYRNERIMKEFKTGKVTEMLHFDNAIESVEPFNQEEEPNYDNIQSTDEFIGTQPERQSPTELETVRETPENEMEANLDGNVGVGCNQNELEANMGGNVGEGGNENELISEDTLNVTPESNLENNKKGDDCIVDMGNIVDEGNETNLDGVLKEGDNDISKRNKENTLSQILTKMNNKKQHAMGDASRVVGGCVQATDGPQKRVKKRCIVDFTPPSFRLLSQDDETDESPQDNEMDELNRVVGNAVAHSLQEVKMIVGRKESPVTRSMDARMEKAKNDRNNKPKSVEYMDVERNEKGDSDQYQQNVDNNDQTVIQNEDPISNDVNVDVITKKQQQVYTKKTKLSLKKGGEGMIESSKGAGYASVAGQEKQICPVAKVIEPINAIPIRYAEPTKDGNDEQKEKRVRELSEALCSPYVKRKVSVTRELQAVEKPVVESIFTGRYNVRDIIFKTSNMEIQRVAFESMHEGFAITKSVIDVWSIIQNNDERLKNKMRSKYLFCKTGMAISRNFEDFKRKFEEAMACTNQTTLDKFDLVFFPIIQAGSKANHFYLIVYNLKTLEVDIIDNKKEESQDIVRRYGEIPKRLTTSFGVYLQSVGHSNGIKMSKVKPKIMHMDWKTTTNYLDAGVFVMRHMECFYGRKNRFNAGILELDVRKLMFRYCKT
ncbi:ulp1 protease family, C-terminal catalytic domain-containing protein [Tanacetum coccineum]